MPYFRGSRMEAGPLSKKGWSISGFARPLVHQTRANNPTPTTTHPTIKTHNTGFTSAMRLRSVPSVHGRRRIKARSRFVAALMLSTWPQLARKASKNARQNANAVQWRSTIKQLVTPTFRR
jgi:hypothetical protein